MRTFLSVSPNRANPLEIHDFRQIKKGKQRKTHVEFVTHEHEKWELFEVTQLFDLFGCWENATGGNFKAWESRGSPNWDNRIEFHRLKWKRMKTLSLTPIFLRKKANLEDLMRRNNQTYSRKEKGWVIQKLKIPPKRNWNRGTCSSEKGKDWTLKKNHSKNRTQIWRQEIWQQWTEPRYQNRVLNLWIKKLQILPE